MGGGLRTGPGCSPAAGCGGPFSLQAFSGRARTWSISISATSTWPPANGSTPAAPTCARGVGQAAVTGAAAAPRAAAGSGSGSVSAGDLRGEVLDLVAVGAGDDLEDDVPGAALEVGRGVAAILRHPGAWPGRAGEWWAEGPRGGGHLCRSRSGIWGTPR